MIGRILEEYKNGRVPSGPLLRVEHIGASQSLVNQVCIHPFSIVIFSNRLSEAWRLNPKF